MGKIFAQNPRIGKLLIRLKSEMFAPHSPNLNSVKMEEYIRLCEVALPLLDRAHKSKVLV